MAAGVTHVSIAMPETGTLELTELVGEIELSCLVCQINNEGPTRAVWVCTHGNPGCSTLLCEPHRAELAKVVAFNTPLMRSGCCVMDCTLCHDRITDPDVIVWTRI